MLLPAQFPGLAIRTDYDNTYAGELWAIAFTLAVTFSLVIALGIFLYLASYNGMSTIYLWGMAGAGAVVIVAAFFLLKALFMAFVPEGTVVPVAPANQAILKV